MVNVNPPLLQKKSATKLWLNQMSVKPRGIVGERAQVMVPTLLCM
jgi:hypothetical protein